MNTLYITNTGRVMLNEQGNIVPFEHTREAIDRIIMLKEDTKIITVHDDKEDILEAKAGDLVISFYESRFPHKLIVVNNPEWKENLAAYEEAEQKAKEEWAKKHAETPQCDNCENLCTDCAA